MNQFTFRQKLYVSPVMPYAVLAFGGMLLLGGLQQVGVLGVYFYNVLVDSAVWSLSDVARKIFNLVFVIAGGGLMIAGGQAMLAAKKEALHLREMYHDRPWMCNQQWAAGHIKTEHRTVTIVFGVAMICLSALLLVFVRAILITPPAERRYWPAIAVAVTIYVVIQCYFLNRKWRQSELRLGTAPGVIGGPLEAVVILNESFSDGTDFRVTLKCEYSEWSFEGDSTNRVVTTLWQEDVVVNKFLDTGMPGKTGIPVYFAIPFDCQSTTLDDVKEGTTFHSIEWLLVVKRDDGGDFRSVQFRVPVYVTENSSPDYEADSSVLRSYSDMVTAESVLANLTYRCEPVDDGERIQFSLRRWPFIIAAFVVSVVSAACILGIISWLNSWPLILIAMMVPVSVFVICLLAILEMLLWRGTVTIRGDEVEVVAGYPYWTQQLSLTRDDAIVMEPQVEFRTASSDFRFIQIQSAAAVAALEEYLAAVENDEEDESQIPPEVICISVIKRLPGRQAAVAVQQWLADRIQKHTPT